jgi:hypothetical protein
VLPVQGCKSLPSAGTASLRFPDRTDTWTVPHLYDTDKTGHSGQQETVGIYGNVNLIEM